jgi:hypothetical protein
MNRIAESCQEKFDSKRLWNFSNLRIVTAKISEKRIPIP